MCILTLLQVYMMKMNQRDRNKIRGGILGGLLQGMSMIGIIAIDRMIPEKTNYVSIFVSEFGKPIFVLLFGIIIGAFIGVVGGSMINTNPRKIFWYIFLSTCFSTCFAIFGAVNGGLIGASIGAIGGALFGALTKVLMEIK